MSISSNKTFKICLLWHNLDSSNLGVSALAISHLIMLVQAAEYNHNNLEVDMIGNSGSELLEIQLEMEKRLNIKISNKKIGLSGIKRKLLRLDFNSINAFHNSDYDYVFDIGEGDSFSDIYGLKRFFIFLLTKWFVVSQKIPLVISPQTIGPFKYKITSRLAAYILKRSHCVYVRDSKSSDCLKSLNVNHDIVSDVAFILPFEKKPKICNSVGINISALLWHGGYTRNNQFGLDVDYRNLVVDIIREMVKRDKKVYLISHVITDNEETEDDYRTSIAIKDLHFAENDNIVIAPKFSSPILAKNYISQMKFFVGSRMHATIGALSAGVPTIPLAYSRKFSGVFESINYKYTIDLYGEKNHCDIIKDLFNLYDHSWNDIAAEGDVAVKNAIKNLEVYRKYLRGILR